MKTFMLWYLSCFPFCLCGFLCFVCVNRKILIYYQATCLRTNLACNTFMRGPGYFQSIFFSDQVFEQMGQVLCSFLPLFLFFSFIPFSPLKFVFSQILAMNPDSLKRLNFYQKGDVTPYYQTLTYWSMTELWDKLLIKSDYDGRLKQIEVFFFRWVGVCLVFPNSSQNLSPTKGSKSKLFSLLIS